MNSHQSHRLRHTPPRVIYRFVSGRHLGNPTTDSTYLYPAVNALTSHGRASRWARLPGWKRQVTRVGSLSGIVGSAYSYVQSPVLTEVGAGTLTVGAISVGSVKAWHNFRLRKHTREVVNPLRYSVCGYLYPNGNAPKNVVNVPLDVEDEGTVRIELPGYISGGERTELLDLVKTKLGMHSDTSHEWHLKGRDQYLSIKRLPLPPAKVTMTEDVIALLYAAKESAPIIGLGRRGIPVTVDLDSESPHVLIALPTGKGKSVVSRALASQLMRHGAQITCLDIKRQSQRWMRNLPGVTYARDIAEIHNAVIAIDTEGDRRNRLTDDIDDDTDTTVLDVGPRIVLLCEEMNSTMAKLQTYWNEIRLPSDVKVSPAVAAFRNILFVGRAVKINIIAIVQSGTVKALGGPEARENFIARIIGGSANQWKMLAPHIVPIPHPSKKRGRFHIVSGEDVHLTQGLFMTDREAKEWAVTGTVTVPVSWTNETESDRIERPTVERRLSLAEIAREGVVPITYGTLRTYKRTDSNFPSPVGRKGVSDTYRIVDIEHWWESRSVGKAA